MSKIPFLKSSKLSIFPLSPTRFFLFVVCAAAIYGAADFLFSWNPWAAAPYLLHRQEPVFRAFPALRLGLLAEDVNGLLAATAFLLLRPALPGPPWKQGLLFGFVLWGFWVVSGTLTVCVWLDIPYSVAAFNILFGLPKCLAIGYGIARTHLYFAR